MRKSRRPTIRDVAEAAGVSLTTVSDALSGKGRLPGETREKVERIARQLNYRPNAIARGLQGKSLGLIGISIAPAESATLSGVWYWASIATHASEAILHDGFAPVLLPHSVAKLARLPIPLDGAIVVDPIDNDEVLAFLAKENIPAVTIGRDSLNPIYPWVDDNNEKGICDLLSRTVRPGAGVVAITLGSRKSYVVDALCGARDWAERTHSMVDELHCPSLDDTDVDAAISEARTRQADVILAQNDRLAGKVLARLKAMDLRVPEHLRLISASDARDLQYTDPPITSLCQHPERLAKLATKLLFDVLHGRKIKESTFLPVELALRQSAPALDKT
jgi:DNA-binding LacI/PurR family transcriptional regulator